MIRSIHLSAYQIAAGKGLGGYFLGAYRSGRWLDLAGYDRRWSRDTASPVYLHEATGIQVDPARSVVGFSSHFRQSILERVFDNPPGNEDFVPSRHAR